MDSFSPFTPLHAASLLGCALAVAAAVSLGLVARRHHREAAVGVTLGVLGLLNWLVQTGYYALLDWDPTVSLPLHICDLAALLGPLALLTRYRPLRSLLYFWAFAFTTQGLITPTLEHGPATAAFWLFWCNHAGVVGLAVYDTAVRRYRPALADLLQVAALSFAYIAVIFPINVVMHWNYAFVGPSRPSAPTIIDALGPWPRRVPVILFMGFMMMVHVYLPWPLLHHLRHRRGATTVAKPPTVQA